MTNELKYFLVETKSTHKIHYLVKALNETDAERIFKDPHLLDEEATEINQEWIGEEITNITVAELTDDVISVPKANYETGEDDEASNI